VDHLGGEASPRGPCALHRKAIGAELGQQPGGLL